MKRTMLFLLVFVWAFVGLAQAEEKTYVLLSEDFEGLPLGPNVDETTVGDKVWTKTPPSGWTIDDKGVPGAGTPQDGVTEWAGWSFANRVWWTTAAADQTRSMFTKGVGTVAVADPDEWDDLGHAAGRYNTYLSTPPIDVSNAKPGSVVLTFDSSWRPEFADYGEQSGNLKVSFDGGPAKELFLWLSDTASPKFKPDSQNETVTIKIDNPAGATTMVLTFGLFNCGNNWWWAIDNVVVTGIWSGIRASHPTPDSGAKEVSVKTTLSWTPGEFVGKSSPKHRISLSNDPNALNAPAAVVATQDANSFDATGRLNFGTTYYWRVDEANGVAGWDKGNVWSFTTEAVAYPLTGVTATASSFQAGMGPEKTVDGSGLTGDLHGTEPTTMWMTTGAQPAWIQYEFDKVYKLHRLVVWNSNQVIESFLGFGAKKVTVETSTDGKTWAPVANVPEFSRGPGAPGYAANTTVDFAGANAKYVKLTINGSWGGVAPQTGLAEVRFFYIPVQARAPQPATGAKGVSVETALTWRAGREAASHKVCFGTDQAAVTAGTAATKTVSACSFAPGALNFSTIYYWKVDEVNAVTYPGDVWSFTTEDYKVVDDFESYTDKAGKEVFSTWIDGFADNYKSSGSTVGLDTAKNGTFGETTIIHGGRQSMPLAYDNSKAPISEAVRTFDKPQDWTASGIKSLSLWFQGVAGNGGQLYVKINSTKVSYSGDAMDLARPVWQVWNIDLSKAGNVSSVRSLTIGIEGAGAKGTLYVDDIRLYAKAPEYIVPVQPAATGLVAYYTFDEGSGTTVKDSSGKGNNGTFGGAPKWVTGYKGGALQLNGSSDYVIIDAVAKSMPANNNFTISAWIKTKATAGYVVASNDSASAHDFTIGPASNGNLQVVANSSRNYPPKINDDQWHMITYVRDGTTAYVYIDGLLVGTETPSGNPATQVRWSIGQEWDGATGPASDFYNGLVDDVRFYARPLSAGEVAGLAGLTKNMAKPF